MKAAAAENAGGALPPPSRGQQPPCAAPVLSVDLAAIRALRARSAELSRLSTSEAGGGRRRFAAASLQAGAQAGAAAAAAPSSSAGGKQTAEEAAAEAELERSFNKADFARMRLVGQFNLGFILATLGSDLFIIDQHASDEKFNFERLQRTTVLNKQPLIRPQPLQLTAAEEQTVLHHMQARGGFLRPPRLCRLLATMIPVIEKCFAAIKMMRSVSAELPRLTTGVTTRTGVPAERV